MLNIELTLGQKLQIGVAIAVFALAGYLFFRGSKTGPDNTVTSWVESRQIGLDPRQPVGPRNPADPTKSRVVTIFACHDGQLEITEYADDSIRPILVFRPDRQRKSYIIYRSPMDRANAIGDPYKRALAMAAYSAAEGRPLGLLGKTDLSNDQAKSEKDLRQEMLEKVDDVKTSAENGHFLPDIYENVLRSLTEYKAKDGDPSKDSAKAELAQRVLTKALDYIARQKDEEAVAVEKYIQGVDNLLNDDQKGKLVEAATRLVKTTPPPSRGGGKPRGPGSKAS